MEELLDIATKLQETETTILRLKNAISQNPEDKSFVINLQSIYKRQKHLEEAFALQVNEQFEDVCTYRFISDNGSSPKISSLTKALSDFQSLFTVVYDALINGPKTRPRISEDTSNASSFTFGYTFIGSVGFALTMPNERLLLGETNLDRTMSTIFELAKCTNSQEIASFAGDIGVASIRKMYQWAGDHAQSSLDADIQWRRKTEVRSKLLIQVPQLEHLQRTIDQTSDEEEEIITVTGQLVGADVKTRSFHMTFENAVDLRGALAETLQVSGTLELPQRYTAKIRKVTKTYYSIEKEDTNYILIELT